MQKGVSKKLFSTFEEAVNIQGGIEFWYARDLMRLLGYKKWENFENAIEKAKESCRLSGNSLQDHFSEVMTPIELGQGRIKHVDDIMLTRLACYLIAQNGDSNKNEIAYAQSYFAHQTRKAELIEQRFNEIERLQNREKLTATEVYFSRTMYEAGIDGWGFGRIRSEGDKALFGNTTAQMKKKFNVNENRPLADFLPSIAIKAKDFANEITSYNIKKNNLEGEAVITTEHIKNNSSVKNALKYRGINTEEFQKEEDLKKISRKVKSDGKKALKETKALPKANPMNF
jgi:DNA-damage-inducible protein D